MSPAKYPMSVEYPHAMSLEVSFNGGALPPIYVDNDGHFYMYSSATDVYYPVRYSKTWEDSYPKHYHDHNRYCGHHPFINLSPSENLSVEHMKVGLEKGSKIPRYAECPPVLGEISDDPWAAYVDSHYDHYYPMDGFYCHDNV